MSSQQGDAVTAQVLCSARPDASKPAALSGFVEDRSWTTHLDSPVQQSARCEQAVGDGVHQAALLGPGRVQPYVGVGQRGVQVLHIAVEASAASSTSGKYHAAGSARTSLPGDWSTAGPAIDCWDMSAEQVIGTRPTAARLRHDLAWQGRGRSQEGRRSCQSRSSREACLPSHTRGGGFMSPRQQVSQDTSAACKPQSGVKLIRPKSQHDVLVAAQASKLRLHTRGRTGSCPPVRKRPRTPAQQAQPDRLNMLTGCAVLPPSLSLSSVFLQAPLTTRASCLFAFV